MSKINKARGRLLINDVWDDFDAVDEALRQAVPGVVMRHRSSGILTWALLHEIEAEVLAELAASGEHSPLTLNMIRSAPVLGYPNDDRPASFGVDTIMPVIFAQIKEAWNLVH